MYYSNKKSDKERYLKQKDVFLRLALPHLNENWQAPGNGHVDIMPAPGYFP